MPCLALQAFVEIATVRGPAPVPRADIRSGMRRIAGKPFRLRSHSCVARLTAACALLLAGCRAAPAAPTLFELLPPERTGVTFANTLPEDATFNILNYLYYYNGGGVAVGDIDHDGLPDLYFTSNTGSNRLYRNKGNYQFEDITERAGVAGPPGWKTGVTMADVNGDGYVDIYVSAVNHLSMQGHNVLYINNRDGTFTDRTKEYGLDHVGYSTQALFFDYDGDGRLDMFLLNHSTHDERAISDAHGGARPPGTGDRLFHNVGGHFVDVTEKAGILGGKGYGLGVVASDVNLDGCIDLIVTDDFQEDDRLYLNNCNGTFTESSATALRHTSRFSMGVDVADFNNDGRPDMMVVDMMPERESILKTSAPAEGLDVFNMRLKAGFHPQYARNTLQLNRGLGRFSDIGYLAGVYASDWSWAPLFADLDNDGLKDLFVTTGVYRRPNDMDYITFIGNEAVQASLAQGVSAKNVSLLQKMPRVPMANHAYHNNGDLTFTNVAAAWGLAQEGFSNGAAYVDLNNTGSLDLVVNRINAPAAIYRNHAKERNANHTLTLVLRGSGGNTDGIGAKVIIRQGGALQMLEQIPTRGFESSVDPRLHFGLGKADRVDTLVVIWPDHRYQTLTNVVADRILTLSQQDASGRYDFHRRDASSHPLFATVPSALGIDFKHVENAFNDLDREPLMPHLLSTEGPALAIGDVNGDGLDDVYVGGAKWQPGTLYLQQKDGTFRASDQPDIRADSLNEDVDAVFFDANGDGHPDLFVVSGGNEFWGAAPALENRLYINDGHGHFHRDTTALPRIFENGSCVVAGDFNGDGFIDLFVGSRVVSKNYGLSPHSHLLQNDGAGHFTDVTAEKAPALAQAGMVTSAAWVDYDGDGKLDLVIAGEWMPVRVFHQESGRFVERTKEAGFGETNGWWSSVTAVDLRGIGRTDLVLGNLGLNAYLRASRLEPARLYVSDFAHNGALQQVLTFYKDGVSYPMHSRDELERAIPSLHTRFSSYAAFGASRVEDLFTSSELKQATVLEAKTFASVVALNNGNGTFSLRTLPTEAQFSPIYAVLAEDFDGDGRRDLLVAGNFLGVPPSQGRYDASYGLLLTGRGDGSFAAADMDASKLLIDGEVRHMKMLRGARGERFIVVARNNNTVQVIRPLGMPAAPPAASPR